MTALLDVAGRPSSEDAVLQSLTSYKRYETYHLEVAEAGVRQFMAPGRLSVRPGDRDHVDARAYYADTGSVGVGRMSYGAEVRIDRQADSRYVGVTIPLSGAIRVWRGGEVVEARAGESLVVVAADGRFRAEWSADCDALMLRVTTSSLARAARALTGEWESDRPPRFLHRVLPLEEGYAVYAAARLLAQVLGQYDDIVAVPNGLLHQLSEHALSALLLGLEHDLSGPTKRTFRVAPSSAVRSAIRMIDDEGSGVFNVNELARHVGISVRALELGFRRVLDETPYQYMRRIRLERAHRDLSAADAINGTTVTEIATRWGFFHTGRFAASYKETYGVMPSVTLSASLTGRGALPPVDGHGV